MTTELPPGSRLHNYETVECPGLCSINYLVKNSSVESTLGNKIFTEVLCEVCNLNSNFYPLIKLCK
jgi:hypothetical protein